MTLDFTQELLRAAVRTLPSMAVAFAYAWLMWRVLRAATPTVNPALFVHRLSLVGALVLGMLGIVPDIDPDHPWQSLGLVVIEGAWVVLALLTAQAIVDWVLFPRIRNLTLIAQGNLAVALAEGGFYLGLGFILWGSLTGAAPDVVTGALSAVVFYALGVAFVVALFWLREWITHYSLRERLAEGDQAAAADLAGTLLGTSMVVAVACSGDFDSWGRSLVWFLLTAVLAVALLHLVRLGVRLTVIGRSMKGVHEDRDVPAAAAMGAAMVLAGLVVAAVTLTVL